MKNDDDDKKKDDATAEALRVLAGQMGTAAGQLIGLQIAIGAILESSPNRAALNASIWTAWERIRANIGDNPSDSHRLVMQSLEALLRHIGVREPEAPTQTPQ